MPGLTFYYLLHNNLGQKIQLHCITLLGILN
nr:MAG TPA: hypothetical protein [Caudoviricetes sp.]